MLSKINTFKFLLIIIIFSNVLTQEVDDNDEKQLFEGIINAIKELKIPYSSYEDTIDQKLYIKLLKHLMLSEVDSMGMMGNLIEDSFLLKLSREVTENLPKEIKIKDLPKYLNPRIIEPIINKILNDIDFNSLLDKIGDVFGFKQAFNEQMKERDRKDKERQKINQERIKRNELRKQQMKMEQNLTEENNENNDVKEGDKKDGNKDVNNDL